MRSAQLSRSSVRIVTLGRVHEQKAYFVQPAGPRSWRIFRSLPDLAAARTVRWDGGDRGEAAAHCFAHLGP